MQSLSIRHAVHADLADVLRLYGQPALDNGRSLNLLAATELFEKMQQYPHYWLFVAALEGRIVGTFTLLIMDNILHLGTPSAIVEAVAVDPEFQGQGIGKQMMQRAMAEARQANCYKLILSSNVKRDRAHQFYDNLGFTRHGYSFYVDLDPASSDLNVTSVSSNC